MPNGNQKLISFKSMLYFSTFLVADTQLYKRLCPSVGWLEAVIELKSGEIGVLDTFCVCLSIGGGLGCGWGLDAPAHPSATIL